jgi:hypothetical protein
MRGMSAATLGIADLPMRLLVAAVVTSIAIPVLWSSYSDLSMTMTERSIEREIREMFEVVQEVMDAGYGTRIKLTLKLDTWGASILGSFIIGAAEDDPSDSDRFIVSYRIEGHARGFRALDPPVAMLSAGGIELSEGYHELWFEHKRINDTESCWIEIA